MITFENTKVFNIARAVYSARNPLNSWDKSDSDLYNDILGENDLKLAQNLVKAGSDHRKFMRQIFVTVDITAPLYWWKEADTYKVGTVANSCSTMHTIHKKEFTVDDFSCEHLEWLPVDNVGMYDFKWILDGVIRALNMARKMYLKTGDKKYWRQMIQLLPSSYNQRRTITMNYENIRNMYHARKNHKLDEWSKGFVEWIDTLPYAEELIKIQ